MTKSEWTEQDRGRSQDVSRLQSMLPCLALLSAVDVTSVIFTRSHIRLGALAASVHALHTSGTVCSLQALSVSAKHTFPKYKHVR